MIYMVLRSMSARLFFKRFVEGEEEGVGHAFAGDVGAWAMAGDDGYGAVEDHQLLEDIADELVVVAAGMVCAADGTGKESVAAEKDFFVRFIVAYASDGVAGGLDDIETEAADLDGRLRTRCIVRAVRQATAVRTSRFPYIHSLESRREGSTEPLAEIFVVLQGEFVIRMHVDRNSIPRSELRHAENMVEMSMSEHDADRLQAFTVNE